MTGTRIAVVAIVASLAFALAAGAQSTEERMDDLLASWRGKTLDELRTVWGRESEVEMRGSKPVYVYVSRVKVRAGVFGATVTPGGGVRCTVRFEVGESNEIARAWRQGSGQDCWSAFRRREP